MARQTPGPAPHDLRRLFKSVGAEIVIDPVILNLLVGHTVKGVDKHYLAKLRISVLRAAAQRIADEIDNPRELPTDDGAVEVAEPPGQDIPLESVESFLPSLEDLCRCAAPATSSVRTRISWYGQLRSQRSRPAWASLMLVWRKRVVEQPFHCQAEATGRRSAPVTASEWFRFPLHRPGSQSS